MSQMVNSPFGVDARERRNSALGRELTCIVLVSLVPILAAQVMTGADLFYYLGVQVAVWATFALAFDLLIGFAGIASFGHAMFFGVGGYAVALIFLATGNLGLALLGGLLAGIVLGFLVGYWVIRTFGVAILLVTFAIAQGLWLVVLANPYGLTGGDNGLPGVQPPDMFGVGRDLSLYLLAVAVFLASFVFIRRLSFSSFGDVLLGIHGNERRIEGLGFNTRLYKLAAFVISAGFSGLAGGVNAFNARQASPDLFHWLISADVMLCVLLGGRGTLIGPAIAAGALILVRTVLSAYTDAWPIAVGAIYIASALMAPDGIWSAWTKKSDSPHKNVSS